MRYSGRGMRMSSYEQDRSNPIANLDPHYTDPRFKHPQTTYLDPSVTLNQSTDQVDGAGYDYDDRIRSWFSEEEQNLAARQAEQVNSNPKTAEYIETYLRCLYKDPDLRLVHIISGVNVGNGYPYRVYGYIRST